MKKRIPSLLVTLAAALCATTASADVVYRFQSPTYGFVKNFDAPCGGGDCLALDANGSVQGWFLVDAPLPPNLAMQDISAQVRRWSFSNGTVGLASTPARPDMRVLAFQVSTDSLGRISQSVIAVSRWTDGQAGPHARDSRMEYIQAFTGPGMTVHNAPCDTTYTTPAGVADVCGGYSITPETSRANYASGTWMLDAPRPAFRTSAVRTQEGMAGTKVLVFTVTPDKPSLTTPMSLDWRTADDTATAGSDYTATSGTLTWQPGNVDPQNIEVTIHGDTLPEADEHFSVELLNFTGMAPGLVTTAAGTIENDDLTAPPQPTVSIAPTATVREGNAGTTPLSFTVSLSSTPATDVSVEWATADGSAIAPADYAQASGSLRWRAGDSTSRTITVQVSGDTTVEPDEWLRIFLRNASGVNIDGSGNSLIPSARGGEGIGTITNDDSAITPGTVQPVPTLSQWGLAVLSVTVLLFSVAMRRHCSP